MTTDVTVCGICGMNMRQHLTAEREEVVNHKFDERGRLIPLKPPRGAEATMTPQPPAVPAPPAGPNFQPMGDPVLRFVLIEAGVITVDQLEAVETKLRATGFLVANPQNNRAS